MRGLSMGLAVFFGRTVRFGRVSQNGCFVLTGGLSPKNLCYPVDNVDNLVYKLIFCREKGGGAGDKFCGQVWAGKVDKWISGEPGRGGGHFFVHCAG